ncbi:MAG: thiamine phosphate synthase [Actinomycetota bacterium]
MDALQRLNSGLLYLVTPARPGAGDLDEFLPAVLDAGVDLVQLRDKDMAAGPLMHFCEIVRRRTAQAGALFVVNDRVDIAVAAGADGVHLGQDDLPVDAALSQLPAGMFVGTSNHTPAQLDASIGGPAGYCAIGPVFETPTKPGRPAAGLELVRYAFARDSGQASMGLVSTGQASTGLVSTGLVSTGQASTAPVSTGQASTGQASTGQASTGQASTGQASTGQASTGQASTGQVSTGAASMVPVSGMASDRPVFAIGGISLDNLLQVLDAGARRICVVRAITESHDPAGVARRLRAELERVASG